MDSVDVVDQAYWKARGYVNGADVDSVFRSNAYTPTKAPCPFANSGVSMYHIVHKMALSLSRTKTGLTGESTLDRNLGYPA